MCIILIFWGVLELDASAIYVGRPLWRFMPSLKGSPKCDFIAKAYAQVVVTKGVFTLSVRDFSVDSPNTMLIIWDLHLP
jgi:hypothetical protein